MSETPSLTAKQLEAIALLSQGLSQQETADRLDVSRKTISRWMQVDEFRAELERRKQRTTEIHQAESDRLQDEQISSFYEDIRRYRKACLDSYQTRLSIAVKTLQLLARRINSMAEEDIAPALIPSYLGAINALMDSALAGWADTLAIDQLLTRLGDPDGTEGGE